MMADVPKRPDSSAAVWPIIRSALANSTPRVRRMVRIVAIGWIAMVALQVWDSRDGRGAGGVAEFLSATLGICGIGLLGLAGALQVSMEEVATTQPSGDAAGVARVLLALPAVGFIAGVVLGCAATLMVMRGILGANWFFAIAGVILYGALMIVAARPVMRSTRMLYDFAGRHARAAADERAAAIAARLDALRARMNPHMLFNALNTVASLVRTHPPAAERVVEGLADVLRRTLDRSSEREGTVRDEVEYVRACLALEHERWGEHLRVSWSVDDSVLERPMPAFVIQPLVENALKHGLGSRIHGGLIRIDVGGDGLGLRVRVEDNGPGFRRNWVEGQGLGNLRQRLQTMYGGEASLTIVDSRPGSAAVVVRLPGRQSRSGGPLAGG